MRAPESSSPRVLITGATSGLGEALALRFGGQGARVAVTGRNPEKLRRSAERVAAAGGDVLEIPLEVTRLEDFEKAAATVQAQWGGLDWLVNNAGVIAGAPLEGWSFESWRHVLDVNLWSVIYGCKVLGPLVREGGGRIVNVASSAAFAQAPEMASYSVSKAAVVALSETLRVELAPRGIGVTVSCPGVFQSDLLNPEKITAGDKGERIVATLEGEVASSRMTSDDIAACVLRCAGRDRLYCVPGFDMKGAWLLKRWFPEWNRKLLGFLFRKRLWHFARLDEHTGPSAREERA